ncbi:tRNA (adenosine(37)-N6)-threonylcarbamoyltransferase complex dimerization subunit type 1 TsaB [Eubacteriales bacterium OttesenSCG-928-M02]|nr:tRNA (adenosine(37)-N6)-threonylcarbamoyltransferase complex dimerization subunit type 1 TsaB [Eubacteriales bacterium OttesenSCG-928-M02]
MLMLAMDTSARALSAALFLDGVLVGEHYENTGLTHSEKLLPVIDTLVAMCGYAPAQLEALAVTVGPGSFTGLRIGVATAQGMGQALGVDIAPVPTLAALAYGGKGFPGLVCPMVDARRSQVYTAIYEDGRAILPQSAMDIEALLQVVFSHQKPVYFLGDGIEVHREQIEGKGEMAVLAPQALSLQRASWVGAVALEKGIFLSPAQIEVDYLRPSQAERLLREKQNGI